MSTVEVGAYFYPLTTDCADRAWRAQMVGEALGMPQVQTGGAPNEFKIIADAPALFDGHDQPRTYCLDAETTEWDDGDTDTLLKQVEMARAAGLSYFVIDAYTGMQYGRAFHELSAPLDRLQELCGQQPGALGGFKYARMETLEAPRVVLPIPPGPGRGISGMFTEPHRGYDLSDETARLIVDANVPHWDNTEDYLYVDGRPYLAILMPSFRGMPEADREPQMSNFMDTLRSYAAERGYTPYLVGIQRNMGDTAHWARLGVDAISHYISLPDFSPDAPPIQTYAERVADRQETWEVLREQAAPVPYKPTPAVGWDHSPRGERGHSWERVAGMPPYSPIVLDGTPLQIEDFVASAIAFVQKHVPPKQQLVTIFAWNELGEAAGLVGRRMPDGTIDNTPLEAVSRAIARTRGAGTAALQGSL